MATTMRLAKQKVGRSLDAAETISTSPIEQQALHSQQSIVVTACFWRAILNDCTKFIPFFATLRLRYII